MFSYDSVVEYQLEITTYCNAACPQCPRNINGGEVNPHLPLCHLDRDLINTRFSLELCNKLKQIFFCGSYGDPIVHPEFLEIVKDFRNKSKTLWIYIHTNGGYHNLEWWKELAEVIGPCGKIDFGIDGLEDTNHLYRRHVDFRKVINNAQSFIQAGGKAQWNYIVFEHNQHQIEAAKILSQIIGFEQILFRGTGRFLDHENLIQKDSWQVTPKNAEPYELQVTSLSEYQNSSMQRLEDLKKEYNNIKEYFDTTPIKCDACVNNKLVITAEGLVLPCNFFEHNLYDARFYDRSVQPGSNDLHFVDGKNQVRQLLESYDMDRLNINNYSLQDILQNDFWSDLVASWNKTLEQGRVFECAFTCGQKLTKVWDQNKTVQSTYRYYITGNNRGLGLVLSEYFHADGSSRSSGKDITKDVNTIAEESLHYDVFINNAFDGPPDSEWGNYGQVNLLQAVYKKWKQANKKGWIFNIGSSGEKTIVAPDPDWETYRVAKAALNHASKQCSTAYKQGLVNFKTTLISPDRLDTTLSRSKDTWQGGGIDCTDIAKFIEYAIAIKDPGCVDEIEIGVNRSPDKQS